jgi:hypothetical protein
LDEVLWRRGLMNFPDFSFNEISCKDFVTFSCKLHCVTH